MTSLLKNLRQVSAIVNASIALLGILSTLMSPVASSCSADDNANAIPHASPIKAKKVEKVEKVESQPQHLNMTLRSDS